MSSAAATLTKAGIQSGTNFFLVLGSRTFLVTSSNIPHRNSMSFLAQEGHEPPSDIDEVCKIANVRLRRISNRPPRQRLFVGSSD